MILVNDIPERVDKSWYRGKVCVGIKISATDPSTALQNGTEVASALIEKFDTKEAVPPVLIFYTDGGPEHRTTYLSVKICLQKYLDLDRVLAVHTAPGHSYRNPAEKINCLLNIGLYGIGCMRQHSTDPFFEQSLSRSTGLVDVRKLIEKNSDRNTKLLKECCQPCMNLISETFSRLKLKDEQFKVYDPSTHKEINKLFKTLKPNYTMTEFSQRPELAQYQSHCAWERTYFVSLKKCGSRDCIICKPPRLHDQDFRLLNHLRDPIPGTDNHYKEFSEVFGTETTEGAMPSLKTSKDCGHKIPFNPVKQHASSTSLIIDCNECSKPRLVYTAKRLKEIV